jgi:hypothetical protein
VENDDHFLFWKNPFAIDANAVGFGNAGGEFDAGRAIDLHPAGLDQFIAGATGSYPA